MTVSAIHSPDYLTAPQIRELARAAGSSVPKSFFYEDWSACGEKSKTEALSQFLIKNPNIIKKICAEGCRVKEALISEMGFNVQLLVFGVIVERTLDSGTDRRQVEEAIVAGLADYVSSELTRKLNGE